MKHRRCISVLAALALAFVACSAARAEDDPHAAHHALAGEAPVSDHSVYQTPGTWIDQNGRPFELASLRGHPVLLVLFYGTCESVCPSIVRDVKKIEELLPAADRGQTRFVLVTIDPSVDTPERLLHYASEKGLDLSRWRLLNGGADGVRVLANVLGVKYRPTGTGQYSHTIRITVLDRDGVVADRFDGLTRPVEPIAARVSALLATDAKPAP